MIDVTTGRPESLLRDSNANPVHILCPVFSTIQSLTLSVTYTPDSFSGITSGIWSMEGFKPSGVLTETGFVHFKYGTGGVTASNNDPAFPTNRLLNTTAAHHVQHRFLIKIPNGSDELSVMCSDLYDVGGFVPNITVIIMKWE